jgi:hypothetical protein
MGRATVEILAAIFSLAGVVIGTHGTYMLTRWYHPFSEGGFLASLRRMIWRKLTGKRAELARHLRVSNALAKLKPEDESHSLDGIYWVFVGFVLQTFGAVLVLIDALIINLGKPTVG